MCWRRMIASSLSVLTDELLAGHRDVSLVGHVEAGDDVEQRRLAAARWAHDGDELTAPDVEVGAAQGAHRGGVLLERSEDLADVDDQLIVDASRLDQMLR